MSSGSDEDSDHQQESALRRLEGSVAEATLRSLEAAEDAAEGRSRVARRAAASSASAAASAGMRSSLALAQATMERARNSLGGSLGGAADALLARLGAQHERLGISPSGVMDVDALIANSRRRRAAASGGFVASPSGGSGSERGSSGDRLALSRSPFHFLMNGPEGGAFEFPGLSSAPAATRLRRAAEQSEDDGAASVDQGDSDMDAHLRHLLQHDEHAHEDDDDECDEHDQEHEHEHDHEAVPFLDEDEDDEVDEDEVDLDDSSDAEQVVAAYRARCAAREAAVARDRQRRDEEETSLVSSDSVRIKKEPAEEEDAIMSDIPSLSPSSPPTFGFGGPISPSLSATNNASVAGLGDLPSLLEPERLMRDVQARILAGVPAAVLHIFTIVEEKLAALKQLATQQSSATPVASQSKTANNSSGNPASSSAAPASKASPGVLAEARGTIEKLRRMQSMIETPLFSSPVTSSTSPSTTTDPSTSTQKATEIALTNELSAYRTVLVQALLTFLAICQRAKAMQTASAPAATPPPSSKPSEIRKRSRANAPSPAAAASAPSTQSQSSSSFPTWFPADRLGQWQLLICESLYLVDSSPVLSAAAPDLSKQLKKILVFLCGGAGSTSTGAARADEKSAHRLRDALVFECEFVKLAALFEFGVNTEAGERTLHASESGLLRSSSFTHHDPATLTRLAESVFARRSLAYPQRLKLLAALNRIETLARKRSDSFFAFILNKGDTAELPAIGDSASSPASLVAAPARSSLVYLLYLLSVHFDSDSEELPTIMSLLGIVSQFVPQLDEAYVRQMTAIKKASMPPTPILPSLSPLQRNASTPPRSVSLTPVAVPAPIFRSSSGGTVISSLMQDRGLHSVTEEKEQEEKTEEKSEAPTPALASLATPPTLLAPLFDFLLAHRPELLFAFTQRHLLENGSVAVRAHACSFLFLLWRSLSSGALRRTFFNDVLTSFIDGRSNGPTSANEPPHALTTIAFYGAHAREFLQLVHTCIMDSTASARHVDAANEKPSTKIGEAMDMEIDDAPLATRAKSPSTRAPVAPSAPRQDETDCVDGLTTEDSASAVRRLLDCMSAQSRAFQSHSLLPCYSKLQAAFNLAPTQYFLQSCVCSVCHGHASTVPTAAPPSKSRPASATRPREITGEPSWDTVSLKEVSAEQKHTHCSRSVRLHGLKTIHQLQLKISGVPVSSAASTGAPSAAGRHGRPGGGGDGSLAGQAVKHIRVLNIYFSAQTGVELAALPLPPSVAKPTASNLSNTEGNEHWTLARSVELPDTAARDITIAFPVGLHASALLIHFADCFESFDAVSEGLVCPRCLIPVATRSAACSRCHESVGQCGRCRAIDYEHPDAFQCGECSHSRYGTFTFLLQCKPSTLVAPITSEDARKVVMARIVDLQDKIATLLSQDMRRVRDKIMLTSRQAGSRIALTVAAPEPTSKHTVKKKEKTLPETRLDYRHVAASSGALASPPVASSLRTVYEIEAAALHAKLSALYRELQRNRAELVLYLHGANPFYRHQLAAAQKPTEDVEMHAPSQSSSPRAASLPVTSCFACSKQFLLLGLALLHEMDQDCLVAGHRLGGSSNDLDLLLYFVSAAPSSAPTPFAHEGAFLLDAASHLIGRLVRAHDAADENSAMRWVAGTLESRIARIIVSQQSASDEDELASRGGDETHSELLHALMTPVFDLCLNDITLRSRPSQTLQGVPRVFSVAGASARLKMLFRLLLTAVHAGGSHSSAVSRFVLRPILTLLLRATKISEADKSPQPAGKSEKEAPSAVSAAGTGRAPVSLDMSRQQLRDLISGGGPRDLDDLLAQSALLRASFTGLSGAPPRILSAGGASAGSGSSLSPASLGSLLFGGSPSGSHLPSSLPASLRRAPSGTSSSAASPSLLPAPRRSNFQRSPGLAPSMSPGSSRLGRAGRISAPGSAQQQAAEPSVSPLPPLSLDASQSQQVAALTIQALTNELLADVRAAWRGSEGEPSSSMHLPAWLATTGDSSTSLLSFETWMRNKTADVSTTASPSPSPSPATATATADAKSASLHTLLDQVIESVFSLACARDFRVPASMDDSDDGSMDLTTIRSKVAARRYDSPQHMLQDIERIVFHAEVYRGAETQAHAKELMQAVQAELAKPAIADAIKALEKPSAPVVDNTATVAKAERATEWRRMMLAQKAWVKLLPKARRSNAVQLLSSPRVSSASLLRALLLCPSSLQVRQSAAQLVWSLAYPTHAHSELATMPTFKPTTAKARKRAASASAASNAAALTKHAADAPIEARVFAFVRTFVTMLSSMTCTSSLYAQSYFSLFAHLLHAAPGGLSARFKHYAVARGLVPLVLGHLERQLQAIEAEESRIDFSSAMSHMACVDSSAAAVSEGVHKHHALHGLTMLLSCVLDDPLVLARFKTPRAGAVGSASSASGLRLGEQVMSFFLRIRGLMLVHSSWLDLCSGYLNRIVTSVFTGADDEGKRATLQAYVYALSGGRQEQLLAPPAPMQRATSNASTSSVVSAAPAAPSASATSSVRLSAPLNPHVSIFVLEQVCALIKPPQLEQQCLVTFKKSSTQEEYIRGNMKRAPYLSSSFSPAGAAANAPVLFRHVKDAICTQLKIDNVENMLELLVGGKIVALDVPVMRMYSKWYAEQTGVPAGSMAAGSAVTAVVKAGGGILLVGSASPSMSPSHDGEDSGDDEAESEDFSAAAAAPKSTVLLAGDLPMTVLYRLTGLDGEATEEKIDSLPDIEKKAEDPEIEYALAGALVDSGLRVAVYRLFQSMPDARALAEDVEVRLGGLLLKLLTYATQLERNRLVLLAIAPPLELAHRAKSAAPFAIRVMVDKLVLTLKASDVASAVAPSSASAPAAANVPAAPVATSPILALSLELVSLLGVLLRAHADLEESPASESLDSAGEWSIPAAQLQSLLGCLSLPSVRAHADLSQQLLSLVPLLSFGQPSLLALVEAHFSACLDLASFDLMHTPEATANLEAFTRLAEEIPRGITTETKGTGGANAAPILTLTPSAIGSAIRDYFFSSGLVQRLFTYLQPPAAPVAPVEAKDAAGDVPMTAAAPASSTTPARSAKKRSREPDEDQAVQSLKDRPSLPYVLRLLTGLVHGHAASQALAPQLSAIRILHALEGMASSTRVGPLAESLLASLTLGNAHVRDEIAELRGTKRQEKKRKAMDQRAKMLAKMGFAMPTAGKPAPTVVADALLTGLEESEHIRCSVCHEGYSYTGGSKDASSSRSGSSSTSGTLGFYVYNSQTVVGQCAMNDDESSNGGGEEATGITTVTHFNLIHYRCHQEAKLADKRLKPPKTEWEGATIRNQHTLCNNLFPMLQPPNGVVTGEAAKSSSAVQGVLQSLIAHARVVGSPAGASAAGASGSASSPSAGTSALLNPASPLWDGSDIDASLDQYGASVEQYWQHIPFGHAFAHSRLELLLEDLRTLLSRFAMMESFSNIARGGGKESNIQFIPYLVQMCIFLYHSSSTSASVKDRIDAQIANACQAAGGVDTAASGPSSSPPPRISFGALPFLDPSIGAAFSSPSSSSPAAAPTGPPANLATILGRSSLHDLVPSSHSPGSAIRGSLYADPLDYLEYLLVLTLLFLSPQQWASVKYGLLWRMVRQAKQGLADGHDEDDEAAAGEDADVTMADEASTSAPSAAASKSTSAPPSTETEQKESEQKMSEDAPAAAAASSSSTSAAAESPELQELRRIAQLESLRPVFLFWSFVDSLHSALAPPAGATFAASSSDSFLTGTLSGWYRRWSSRRSWTRAGQLATFRSLLRREPEILRQLTERVLPKYERQAARKDIVAIIQDSAGVVDQLATEDFTTAKLVEACTHHTRRA